MSTITFNVRGVIITIDETYLAYSPYLGTIINTKVGVEKDQSGNIMLDYDVAKFANYILFLQGGSNFRMELNDASFFEEMGHTNLLQYPLDYWRVKLYDDWIRDNFYRLKLNEKEEGLVGLVELDLPLDFYERWEKMNITLGEGEYVAGGSVLYLTGIARTYKDIDIFTCNTIETTKRIQHIIKNADHDEGEEVILSGNAVSHYCFGYYEFIHQYILRGYSCPSEIVHGFDVASSCLISNGKKIWATRRGYDAIKNRCNWFDPTRSSPTYIRRLAKYHSRGFKLMLPLMDKIQMNENAVLQIEQRLMKCFLNRTQDENYLVTYWPNTDIDLGEIIWSLQTYEGPKPLIDAIYNLKEEAMKLYGRSIIPFQLLVTALNNIQCQNGAKLNLTNWILAYYNTTLWNNRIAMLCATLRTAIWTTSEVDDEISSILPQDPVSTMFLVSKFGMTYSLVKSNHLPLYSDYEVGDKRPMTNVTSATELVWTTNDPMSQVSTTFYPEPIESDLIEWYKTSPLISQEERLDPNSPDMVDRTILPDFDVVKHINETHAQAEPHSSNNIHLSVNVNMSTPKGLGGRYKFICDFE